MQRRAYFIRVCTYVPSQKGKRDGLNVTTTEASVAGQLKATNNGFVSPQCKYVLTLFVCARIHLPKKEKRGEMRRVNVTATEASVAEQLEATYNGFVSPQCTDALTLFTYVCTFLKRKKR
jgi:hypothetical protein